MVDLSQALEELGRAHGLLLRASALMVAEYTTLEQHIYSFYLSNACYALVLITSD